VAPAGELYAVEVVCTIGTVGALLYRTKEPSLAMLERNEVNFEIIDCSSKLLSAELAILQGSRLKNATSECTNSLTIEFIYVVKKYSKHRKQACIDSTHASIQSELSPQRKATQGKQAMPQQNSSNFLPGQKKPQ
jgi:hypothetical protein